MKTACLGGSFNPIHHGHLICARAVAEFCGFDRIRLIPCRLPPHKHSQADLAAPQHRLRMCQLAASSTASFDVDDLELFREGPSFTFDTAQELLRRGFEKVNWLIGGDQLAQLPTWHRPLELIRTVNFIIMSRPGFEPQFNLLPDEYRHLQANVVRVPQIQISATEIRDRIRTQKSIDFLTPPAVAQYIHEHGLYQ